MKSKYDRIRADLHKLLVEAEDQTIAEIVLGSATLVPRSDQQLEEAQLVAQILSRELAARIAEIRQHRGWRLAARISAKEREIAAATEELKALREASAS